jgi:hypothetical protein
VSNQPDLISVDEAVLEFRRSRKTIFGWLAEGQLRRYRSAGDRRTLVSRRELAEIVRPRVLGDDAEPPPPDFNATTSR